MAAGTWDFWIDRGGTFTDVIGRAPDGTLVAPQAAVGESRRPIATPPCRASATCSASHPASRSRAGASARSRWAPRSRPMRCSSARATRTLLVTTTGFRDALRIGYQARPKIFAKQIIKPRDAVRARGRGRRARARRRHGRAARPISAAIRAALERATRRRHQGGRDRVHARLPLSRRMSSAWPRSRARSDFAQVSVSHEVSPLIKLVGRGDTTVVDAYLSPILRRYVAQVARDLGGSARRKSIVERQRPRLMFMMSSGGLTAAELFQGKDAILSGPAGGVVGMAETGRVAGFDTPDRLRHGRHLDRRVAFRRRVRARVRDRGRGRAHARADDADPHGRGRRRLDPAFRRRALPRRPGLRRRQSRARNAIAAAGRSR